MKKLTLIFLILSCIISANELFTFAILKYSGGGDWYEAKVGVKNLMKFLNNNSDIKANLLPVVVEPADSSINLYPFIYLTGHGNINFTQSEATYLRSYLLNGGFLYANDDYGMDKSFRIQLKKIFPEKSLVKLPKNHEIFNIYFPFPQGTPKIHKHYGGPGETLALFHNKRIIVLYTFNTDIGDGWAPYELHKDSEKTRTQALKFGINIIIYAMTQ